jgi:hypothetical protein
MNGAEANKAPVLAEPRTLRDLTMKNIEKPYPTHPMMSATRMIGPD